MKIAAIFLVVFWFSGFEVAVSQSCIPQGHGCGILSGSPGLSCCTGYCDIISELTGTCSCGADYSAYCSTNGHCCSNFCNSRGYCGCISEGSLCGTGADCCSGVCAPGGLFNWDRCF